MVDISSQRVQRTQRLLLTLGLVVCLLIVSATGWSSHNTERSRTFHAVAKKRGNMDLAFIQVYQLCDRDRNGRFSALEFRCLNDMLRILIGVSK